MHYEMKKPRRQPTTYRPRALIAGFLVLALAAASAFAAAPPNGHDSDTSLHQSQTTLTAYSTPRGPNPESQLMTPLAQIQLGVGRCDTELMMWRAGVSSATYPLRSPWRGIVEYLLPNHGIFRRGEALARIYDPELLPDLERARRLMSIFDVAPLTIAAHARPLVDPPEALRPAAPADQLTAPEQGADAPATPERQAPPSLRVKPETASPTAPTEVEVLKREAAVAAVELAANEQEQDRLRAQAQKLATDIASGMVAREDAEAALAQAQEELQERQQLYEAGALAEEALRPPMQRQAEAQQALERAERDLSQAQEAYAQAARRIRALEKAAATTRAAIAHPSHDRVGRASPLRQGYGGQALPDSPDQGRNDQRVGPTFAEATAGKLEARPTDERPAPGEASAASSDSALEDTSSADGDVLLSEGAAQHDQAPALAPEVTQLAAPRWQELTAPATGMVADIVAPAGTLVEQGQAVLQLANVQLARLAARVQQRDLPQFWAGRSVGVTFGDYPAVALEGWVASAKPLVGSDDAEVELLVVCASGPFSDDAYLAVEWMALEAGIAGGDADLRAIEPVREPGASAQTDKQLQRLFPVVGPPALVHERASQADEVRNDCYTGRLGLRPMPRLQEEQDQPSAASAARLSALREWRASYIDGMVTTVIDDGTAITYPRDGEVSRAVRRMLESRVSHMPNLCARTMREALGWGLGDAHAWAHRLPRMGYQLREDGLPRPGDVLVWPFTYGPGRAEHIGIAVRQGRRLMLLSNLGGRLGTSEIVGGYLAFHQSG